MTALVRILKTPWIATIRSAYGYLMLLVVVTFAVNLSHALPVHSAAAQFGVAALLTADVVGWKMVVNALWLARDAKALCLPGVPRDANRSPIACGVLTILLPALVLGLAFGHMALWFVSLALVAAMVMAFHLLPTIIAMPTFAVAVIYTIYIHQPPLPGNAGYLDWSLPSLVILVAISAQRWFALMHATSIPEDPRWRPANVGTRSNQLRRLQGGAYGFGAFGALSARQPGKRDKRGELRNIGPERPIRSLRVVLHRTLTPFDTRIDPAHLWRWRVALAVIVLAPPVIALLAERDLGTAPVLAFSPQFLLFAAILLTVTSIHDRGINEAWCGPRADLSLPALLPHLERRAHAHRDALTACVAGALMLKLWCTYSFVMLFAVLHLPAMFYVYLGLILATGIAMQLATTTGILCGRRGHAATGYIMYAVVIAAGVIPMTIWGVRVTDPTHPRFEMLGWPAVACALIWLALCAIFGVMAWFNWRRFRARPHPFLVNHSA